jgi:hypothetical protein
MNAATNAYLFAWNPDTNGPMFDDEHWTEFSANGHLPYGWRCQSNRPAPGDRAYIVRLGQRDKDLRGIVARGTITTSPALNDQGVRFVTIDIDTMTEPDGVPLIPFSALEGIPNQLWNPQPSGVLIKAVAHEALERVWLANAKIMITQWLDTLPRDWRLHALHSVMAEMTAPPPVPESLPELLPTPLQAIMDDQDWTCATPGCGANLRVAPYHKDHVVAKTRGGSNHHSNYQFLCAPCNLSKGARDWEGWVAGRAMKQVGVADITAELKGTVQ